jgi:transcriptional regulator with XRE-family HTH domain
MGRSSRQRPEKLQEKLVDIRSKLNLSQNELIARIGLVDEITREEISAFERGIRVPPLPILLRYAQAAGVWIDVLVDDELNLPAKLPCVPKSEGVRSKARSRRKN